MSLNTITRAISKMTQSCGPVESQMLKKLQEKFEPSHLEVINESGMHNAPKGSESHFKVIIVSSLFDKLPLIKRHRLVNETLAEELENLIHAMSLTTKTPTEWNTNNVVSATPNCRGGFGK